MPYYDNGFGDSGYGDDYWNWLYGNAPNSGQVGFSGGSSGNWWDQAGGTSGWLYDPATDEYYRPDGDYSGGNTFPGNGPTFSATGTDDIYGDSWMYGPGAGSTPGPSDPVFRGGDIAVNPIDPIPSESPNGLDPPSYSPFDIPPGREYDGGYSRRPGERNTAGGTPQPKAPAAANNTTNNKTANLSQTNIASESISNALPPIASGSPAPNPETFDPQYISQSERAAGASFPSASTSENPYDATLAKSPDLYGDDSWKYGPPVTKQPGKTRSAITGAIAGLTGLDFSSKKSLGNSALGLTGVNRYRDLIRDTRRRPGTEKEDPNNPFAPTRRF